jgi:hypothetical protein
MEWNGMEWNHGIMESWNHGIMESWNHGIMESWNGIKSVSSYTHTCSFLPDFTPHMQTASDSGRRTSR